MIVWEKPARKDVRDIYDYLFDQSIAVADELEKKLGLIAQFPEMGRR